MEKQKIRRGTVQACLNDDSPFYTFEQWDGHKWHKIRPRLRFATKKQADEVGASQFSDYRR